MTRHILTLTPKTADEAVRWIKRAIVRGAEGRPWVMEVREPKRSDDQNRALHAILDEIAKLRPTHCGMKMGRYQWKAVFLQALGHELTMMPTLNGNGFFPVWLRSSELTKAEFSDLLELIFAWCAQEGLTIQHFEAAA